MLDCYTSLLNNDIQDVDTFLHLPLPYSQMQPFIKWVAKGAHHIIDIFTESAEVKTFQAFKQEFNLTGTYLLYYRFLHFLPQIWINSVKNNVSRYTSKEMVCDLLSKIMKSCDCKFVYNDLCRNVTVSLQGICSK